MKNVFLFLLFLITFTSLAQKKVILKNPKFMFLHEDTDGDEKFDYSDETILLPETKLKIVVEDNIIKVLNSPEKEEYIIISDIRIDDEGKKWVDAKDTDGDLYFIYYLENEIVTIFNEDYSVCLSYNKK